MKELVYKAERLALKSLRRLLRCGADSSVKTGSMTGSELNAAISDAIRGGWPYMVARFGSCELDAGLYPYVLSKPLHTRYKWFLRDKVPSIHWDEGHAAKLMNPLCNNAGFFPQQTVLMRKFSELMVGDVPELDICCRKWGFEELFEDIYSSSIRYAGLDELEPYDYDSPWSAALKGKKVLVVHPFADSIEKQYSRRELLWENPDVLPEFTLSTIKAVQTIAGQPSEFSDWFQALDYMKSRMDATDYDVAIIGCGAYGFHLAAHAKRTGHTAIHLGGATQILFGIKGRRWDNLPAVSKFYNGYWVYPSADETPRNSKAVEGGCYW